MSQKEEAITCIEKEGLLQQRCLIRIEKAMEKDLLWVVLIFNIGGCVAQISDLLNGDFNQTSIYCNNRTSPLTTLETAQRLRFSLRGKIWIDSVKYVSGQSCNSKFSGDCLSIIEEKRNNITGMKAVCVDSSLTSFFQILDPPDVSSDGEVCGNGSQLVAVDVRVLRYLLNAKLIQRNKPYIVQRFDKIGYNFSERVCAEYDVIAHASSFVNCSTNGLFYCYKLPTPTYTVITVASSAKKGTPLVGTTDSSINTSNTFTGNRDDRVDYSVTNESSDTSYIAPVVVVVVILICGVAASLGFFIFRKFKKKQNLYWEARSPGKDTEHKYAVPTPYTNTEEPSSSLVTSGYYYNDDPKNHVRYVNYENEKGHSAIYANNNARGSSQNAHMSLEVYESVR